MHACLWAREGGLQGSMAPMNTSVNERLPVPSAAVSHLRQGHDKEERFPLLCRPFQQQQQQNGYAQAMQAQLQRTPRLSGEEER